jgi:uncharacterized protein YdeI (YjbR/CyaY-like superfamily)
MRFRAELEAAGGDGRWRIVFVPFKVEEAFGTRGMVKVTGTVNGFAFRSSLFPNGKGEHFLMINKAMQRGAKVSAAGELVEIELAADRPRPIVVPPVLKKALAQNPDGDRCFQALADSWKRAHIARVLGSKNKDVQARRAIVVANKLAELGRGLKQPPPIITKALAESPVAKERFAKLAPSHRREFIAYILDGASEETRKRRAQKMVRKLKDDRAF